MYKPKPNKVDQSGVSYKIVIFVATLTTCASAAILWFASQDSFKTLTVEQLRAQLVGDEAGADQTPAQDRVLAPPPTRSQQLSALDAEANPSIEPRDSYQSAIEAESPDPGESLDTGVAEATKLKPLDTSRPQPSGPGSTANQAASQQRGALPAGGATIGGGSSGGVSSGLGGGRAPDPTDTIADTGQEALDLSKPIKADPKLLARVDLALVADLKAGGKVHIPAGEHVISSVDVTATVEITADPNAKLILAVGSKDAFGLRLLGEGSSIDGLAIDRGPGKSAITVEANDITIERCTITGAPSPADITHGVGIYVRQSTKRIRILGNSVKNGGIGIYTSRFLEDIIIANNIVEDIQAEHGIYCAQANDLLIEGNTLRRINHIAIKSQNDHLSNIDSVNVRIIGNLIEDAGNNAIACTRTTVATKGNHIDLVIRNNVVNKAGGNGIRLRHVDGVLIRGNILNDVNGPERAEWTENIKR